MLKGNDLESKKYFLFDIDGTLAIDDTSFLYYEQFGQKPKRLY